MSKLVEMFLEHNKNLRNNLRSTSLVESFDPDKHGDPDDLGDSNFKGGTAMRAPTHTFNPGGDHGPHAEVMVWHNAGKKKNETHVAIQKSQMGGGKFTYPHPEVPISHIKSQLG